MPGSIEFTNKRGLKILFEEDTHKYSSVIDGKEIVYTSVTSVIHKYAKPFDADKIAPFSAKKAGVSVEEIKRQWAEAGKRACIFGTRTHEICEDIILGREPRNSAKDLREEFVFKHAINMAKALKTKVDIISPERPVFDVKLKIAGTIDLLAKSKKDNSYIIIDWKTNATIDSENKYGDKMLFPLEDLADCNFNHYALQLNTYEYLLKYSGEVPFDTPFKRYLIHLTETGGKFIELPEMQSRVKDIIIDHLVNQK